VLFPSKFLRRKILTKVSAFLSRLILKILGFRIKMVGHPPENNGKMIIGNHMSYLDILIYLSFFETIFVTSVETKEKPFLGQITTLAGCLFVERRNPRKLPEELKNIKQYFEKNISVCIFPEGTSSDGTKVLPFKQSLFQLAIETRCPIQPILLRYRSIDGKPFSKENGDLVCWYGEMTFFPHLFKLFTLNKVQADIEILETVDSRQFSNRKDAASTCFEILSKQYGSY
jgi:1-acyl-sn-glycerol-3-phosphate acyltransferase